MYDYNHGGALVPVKAAPIPLSDAINLCIDNALQVKNANEPEREYLGGSRLGAECVRQLQYEYQKAPREPFKGRTLRIFDTGHALEDLMIGWMRAAGFTIVALDVDGSQFGWSQLGGKMRGHLDGIILNGPPEFGPYPRLWEAKTMKASKWGAAKRHGLEKEHFIYLVQVALYQNYYHLTHAPALLTALNKDTSELHHFEIPFNARLAQTASDKGVRVIDACEAGELLPRMASTPDFFACKWCDFSATCWADD